MTKILCAGTQFIYSLGALLGGVGRSRHAAASRVDLGEYWRSLAEGKIAVSAGQENTCGHPWTSMKMARTNS